MTDFLWNAWIITGAVTSLVAFFWARQGWRLLDTLNGNDQQATGGEVAFAVIALPLMALTGLGLFVPAAFILLRKALIDPRVVKAQFGATK